MRAIENTITEYPGATEGVLSNKWVYSGHQAFFAVSSIDPEAIAVIVQRLTDLFHPGEEGIGVLADEDSTLLSIRSHYTTNYDVVNRVLANVVEHFEIPPILWTSGSPQLTKRLQEGLSL